MKEHFVHPLNTALPTTLINPAQFPLQLTADGTASQAIVLAPDLQNLLFSLSVLGVLALGLYLLHRQTGLLRPLIQQFRSWMGGGSSFRHEARLNKVVCYHCQRGTGLYDPVYRTLNGEAHVEGICSTCGGFVRARLH